MITILSSDAPVHEMSYLHSEPTILSYLDRSDEFDRLILPHLIYKKDGQTVRAVVLNISSLLDICRHCGDTLFYNSALRATFMKNLTAKLEARGIKVSPDLKLVNLISSGHIHTTAGGHVSSRSSQSDRYEGDISFDKLPSSVLQMSSTDLKKPQKRKPSPPAKEDS